MNLLDKKIGCVGHDCAECQRRLRRGRVKEFMVVFEPFRNWRIGCVTAVLLLEAKNKTDAIRKAVSQAGGAYSEKYYKKPHAEPVERGTFYRL